MDEISNKTIIILLIGAIIISLGGTIVSLNKIGKVKNVGITGLPIGDRNASQGNISLTISDITWINFSQRNCYLGTGYVVKDRCELNSSGYYNATSCSASFAGNTCSGLVLKNIGNNNVSVNISWKNDSSFISSSPKSELWFKTHNGTGAASTQNGCVAGQVNFDNKWAKVSRAGQTNITCSRFYYASGQNTMTFHLRVRVDQTGLIAGRKENILTAIGKAI